MGNQKSDCSRDPEGGVKRQRGNPNRVERAVESAWIPVFAGMIGLWSAGPALAHQDDEHGLPGALHMVSADHLGWAVLAAVVLLTVFALRRPIVRMLKVRSRK